MKIIKIRNLPSSLAILFAVTLLSCGESSESAYDRGYDDGYAVGYNTTCKIRATMLLM